MLSPLTFFNTLLPTLSDEHEIFDVGLTTTPMEIATNLIKIAYNNRMPCFYNESQIPKVTTSSLEFLALRFIYTHISLLT